MINIYEKEFSYFISTAEAENTKNKSTFLCDIGKMGGRAFAYTCVRAVTMNNTVHFNIYLLPFH